MNCFFMQHIFGLFYSKYSTEISKTFHTHIMYSWSHPHNVTFLSFSVNGSKEADGDGEGDKTDAQGNNSTTKVH